MVDDSMGRRAVSCGGSERSSEQLRVKEKGKQSKEVPYGVEMRSGSLNSAKKQHTMISMAVA